MLQGSAAVAASLAASTLSAASLSTATADASAKRAADYTGDDSQRRGGRRECEGLLGAVYGVVVGLLSTTRTLSHSEWRVV